HSPFLFMYSTLSIYDTSNAYSLLHYLYNSNLFCVFFFNTTPTTEIYTLSLHDALPISAADLPPSPTKSSNLSETAEVPACNVPSRSPLPALAIAPETKLGTASSGLGTLEP